MDIVALLGENITQGVFIGLIIGVVFQLASKTIRTILIVQFVLIKWLEARSILVIDWHRLTAGLVGQREFAIQEAQSMFDSLVEMGIFGGSLALGFLIGRRLSK
ncbi:MAG: hypothetical protein ISR24_06155 [Candidatus Poseidonia sp.]|nr:hypothetical protein [Poseidonia sp.]MBL6892934.1 hypothetical protein [Poseidonia sp.]